MSSSWQAFSEIYGARIESIHGAVLNAIIWRLADYYFPLWLKIIIVNAHHAYRWKVLKEGSGLGKLSSSVRSGILFCLVMSTQIRMILVPPDKVLRIEYFLATSVVNAAGTFWYHIHTDDSSEGQTKVWYIAWDALVTFAICSVALSYRPWVWRVTKCSISYLVIPIACYGTMLWTASKWTRYPLLTWGIYYPGDKLVMALLAALTGWDILTAFIIEELPRYIQRQNSRLLETRNRVKYLPQYRHRPLKGKEIRLLVIKNGSCLLSSSIETELRHVPLRNISSDDSVEYQYEAVSYHWGSSERSKTIFIDRRPFRITDSAFELLLARRSIFQDRVIWIDSICINQDDRFEKSSQVALMLDIYRGASRVVIFLGSGWKIWLGAKVVWQMSVILKISWMDPNSGGLKSPVRRSALQSLLRNEYFTRVWIIQEIVAGGNVELYLAGDYMSWDLFVEVTRVLFDSKHRNLLAQRDDLTSAVSADTYSNISILWVLKDVWGLRRDDEWRITLDALVFLTTGFRATDPRDKVFALLGIAEHLSKHDSIVSDYSKPCERVFEDLARYLSLYQPHSSSHFLALAGIGRCKPRLALPSWVPDLNQELTSNPLTFIYNPDDAFQASGISSPSIAAGPFANTLAVTGIMCDEVFAISCGGSMDLPRGPNELANHIYQARCKKRFVNGAIQLIQNHGFRCDGGPQAALEKLWNVLLTNRIDQRKRRPGPEYSEIFQHWLRFCEEFAKLDTTQDLEELAMNDTLSEQIPHLAQVKIYEYNMLIACVGRCFAISDEGRLCLVPPLSQVGDKIFIPYGAQTPHLIRIHKRIEPVAAYELVGEAYVDGIMDGEAMIGDHEVTIRLV